MKIIAAYIVAILLALLPQSVYAQSVTTVASGAWSDPAIWSTGTVPVTGQSVTIASGHTVTYNVSSEATLGQLNVLGTLTLSRAVNTRLKLGNSLIVHPGGYLDMGNADSPIPSTVQTELIFVLTLAQANAFNNTDIHSVALAQSTSNIGLWNFGRWDSHGAPVVRTWTKLATTVTNSTVITVENDVTDWPIGGVVIVMPTNFAPATGSYSSRVLSATQLLEDGTTQLTLALPLSGTFLGEGAMRGEVGLLSRNVKISTELIGGLSPSVVANRKFAHTVYMPGSSGDLQYTEFFRMGHFNRTARYAIHHHRMLSGSTGMVVKGNSVWVSGFRCINIHVSHGLVIEDNVCYNVVASGIFTEAEDAIGYNQDNVFIHNLVGLVYPRDDSDNRISAFWVRDQTRHEAWLGNVAVGGAEKTDGAGYSFGEGGNDIGSSGTIPFTFVHNEAHSQAKHGIFTWQNTAAKADMVDTLLWGVGVNCIRWGAYRTLLRYYNLQCLEFGSHGVNITSIDPYIQDAIIAGGPFGVNLSGYVLEQYPVPGATFSRIHFARISNTAMYQKQQQFPNDNANGNECGTQTPGTPSALQQRPIYPGNCSGNFVTMLAQTYVTVTRAMDFGQTANPNSYWIDDTYVYVRPDLLTPGKCGVITCALVNAQTTYDSASDALRTPLTSLPESIYFQILNARPSNEQNRSPSGNYTLTTVIDYPPVVALDVTFSGATLKMSAMAADDNAVSEVKFFLNWQVVGVDDTPPYTAEIDLTGYALNYAYPYASAVDSSGQRAYSSVMEIGPEVLRIQCVIP